MQLANQASQLSLVLAANSQSSSITGFNLGVTLFSKYGHFWLQITRWQWPKSKLEASKQQSTNQWVTSVVHYLYSVWIFPAEVVSSPLHRNKSKCCYRQLRVWKGLSFSVTLQFSPLYNVINTHKTFKWCMIINQCHPWTYWKEKQYNMYV